MPDPAEPEVPPKPKRVTAKNATWAAVITAIGSIAGVAGKSAIDSYGNMGERILQLEKTAAAYQSLAEHESRLLATEKQVGAILLYLQFGNPSGHVGGMLPPSELKLPTLPPAARHPEVDDDPLDKFRAIQQRPLNVKQMPIPKKD